MKKLLTIAALGALAFAAQPAYARDHDGDGHHDHEGHHGREWHDHGWHGRPHNYVSFYSGPEYRPVYVAPPVAYYPAYPQPVYPVPAYGVTSLAFVFR